jgi:hypothetical protein
VVRPVVRGGPPGQARARAQAELGSAEWTDPCPGEAELRRWMQQDVVVVARAERKTVAEAGERYVQHLAKVESAIATARLSSTTGEPVRRTSSPYRAATCGQSISSSVCREAIAACGT